MKNYYEATTRKGLFGWKIYHYDATGEKEVVVARGEPTYKTEGFAIDAASEWMEDNNIEAELV